MTTTNHRSPITTHVLDTALGRPAPAVPVRLEVMDMVRGVWTELAAGQTDGDGRLTDLLRPGHQLQARTYRLIFDTGAYLRAAGSPAFYPRVEVTFDVSAPDEHHHIPLLLSPFGYSTYRGS
jgi:5-hydroxyisourate hydrolase